MDFEGLREAVTKFTTSRIIQVAVDLAVFDVLASESRTAKGVADVLKTDERATGLLLNALTGIGLLEKANGKYTNTGVSQQYLVSSSPKYYGWIIKHGSHLWKSWGELEESIKTGRPPKSILERKYTDKDQEAFIMGMHSIITARGDVEMLTDKLGLENCSTMLDLAGGPGSFAIEFARNHPKLNAVVFDLPETIAIAKKVVSKNSDVADKIRLVEGDFLTDELPSGNDLVFISNIIHMLDENGNLNLIKKAFKSLNNGGSIIVKDHILTEDLTKPVDGSVFAINMLLHAEGRCYSCEEIEGWMGEAGCHHISRLELPADTPYGVVIGKKS